MTGRLAFAFHLGSAGAPTGSRRSAQGPLRALVIGDFAMGGERGPLRVRQPARVDIDDLEARLSTLQPCVVTGASPGDGPVALAFRSLEDFHPDRLCRQVPLLRRALELRARLASPTAGIDACMAQCAETFGERCLANSQPDYCRTQRETCDEQCDDNDDDADDEDDDED